MSRMTGSSWTKMMIIEYWGRAKMWREIIVEGTKNRLSTVIKET